MASQRRYAKARRCAARMKAIAAYKRAPIIALWSGPLGYQRWFPLEGSGGHQAWICPVRR